jgi:DNA-binding PadR family transcriptional regulator
VKGDGTRFYESEKGRTLLRLEQEWAVASEWGPSESNRRARFFRLTPSGRKLLETEKHDWEQTAAIIARFFKVKAEDLS